jgi:hypothetical protein
MDAKLGRAVLDVVDYEPEHFSMLRWGGIEACGTVACLAGTALLKAGCTLRQVPDGFAWCEFRRPDGSAVTSEAAEAQFLLGLTDDEVGIGEAGTGIGTRLWHDYEHGVERFRALVEKAEKAEAADAYVYSGADEDEA